MLLGFPRVKQSNFSMESQISTEQQLNFLDETAYTESPTDVMTIRDRSHLTHQERQKFWENATYSTQPCSSNRDTEMMCPTEMEITTSWKEEGRVEGRESGERGLVIKLLTKKVGNLSPELLARVSSLNIDRLEALAEDLLDFKHVGDLERWMAV
jgi:Domain of unknown function (DUF4351)